MAELPPGVVEEAERLTRLIRRAGSDEEAEAYREKRAALLAAHGFTARVRSDEGDETLVCYPDEWVEDDVVRPDRIEDLDRAVEVPLDGPGEPDEWDELYERNHEVADRVREEYGEIHGANAEAFAEFVSNHYAKPIESSTPAELEEFRTEYYPRNVWPSEEEADAIDRSLERVFEVVDVPMPTADESRRRDG